jgi:hypothetical protein
MDNSSISYANTKHIDAHDFLDLPIAVAKKWLFGLFNGILFSCSHVAYIPNLGEFTSSYLAQNMEIGFKVRRCIGSTVLWRFRQCPVCCGDEV